MSRTGYVGPKLPRTLLDQVQDGRVSKNGRKQLSRKEQRKVDRQQVKVKPSTKRQPGTQTASRRETDERAAQHGPVQIQNKIKSQPSQREDMPKSILKKASRPDPAGLDEESDPPSPQVPRSVQIRLDADNAEIAALEKKLGVKKKSKSSDEDGLDWLMDGLDEDDDDEDADSLTGKRKRKEYDAYLRSKRSKINGKESHISKNVADDEDSYDTTSEEDEEFEVSDENADGFDESGDEFEGFDEVENISNPATARRIRENPYTAPISKDETPSTAKYIPPSLRQIASSDDETSKQLRRQIQGLLNRLSEANIISILGSIEQIYAQNARQYVTSVLIDLLDGLICDPAALSDTFIILHAGFATAVYRVIGTDFGAQLLEAIVQSFDEWYKNAESSEGSGKQTLNIIAFMSNLYIFQAVGCETVFDYMRMLLENFSETSTELLLRMIRIAGSQLRQDDPSALRDAVLLLQRAIAKSGGEDKLSVRTKVMVETIHNLKNNRVKTGLLASAVAAEHTHRMRRTLGTLNTRPSKTTEALHITLADIRDSDKKGKWWLVGASYRDPSKMANSKDPNTPDTSNNHAPPDEIRNQPSTNDPDSDNDLTSTSTQLTALARAQGMNTDIRRAIFVSIMGAVDYTHARVQLDKLNLKSKQQLEIPRVLLHCASAEPVYNHFYTLVAMQFCGEHRFRIAFETVLKDLFRRMGETGEDEDDSGDGGDHFATTAAASAELSVPAVYNLAKMFSVLLAKDYLRVTVLKALDLQDLQSKTRIFVEVLLTELIMSLHRESRSKSSKKKLSNGNSTDKDEAFAQRVSEAFTFAHVLPDLCISLHLYLQTTLIHTEIAKSKKDKKVIVQACEIATSVLANRSRAGVLDGQTDGSDAEGDDIDDV